MSSGTQRLLLNTLERLVSNDSNRAQAFLATAQQEAWRARYGDVAANWRLFPGLAARASTITAPLTGDVYSGLFVRPDAGSYLTIEEGLAMLIDPINAGLDDSPYLYVKDPGVTTPGVLTFTANLTIGTVRWDVVECQPIDQVLESENRDIYNPTTGIFNPTSVPKVRATRLVYRIRLGNPGAGFSGGAVGWLPLAVIAVRDGATSFEKCDLYDVRPLVSERVLPQPLGSIGNEGYATPADAFFESSGTVVYGYSEASFGGYLAGGALQMSSVPTNLNDVGSTVVSLGGDSPGLCYTNPDVNGIVSGSGQSVNYIAALFPFITGQGAIPRWARYSEAPVASLGRRVPNGPRGVVIFTATPPGPNGLFASTSFPTAMQMGVTGAGVCLGAIINSDTGSVHQNRRYHQSLVPTSILTPAGLWKLVPTTTTATTEDWALVANSHFPVNAKNLRCSIGFHYSSSVSGNLTALIQSIDSFSGLVATQSIVAFDIAPSTYLIPDFEIPIPPLVNGADPHPYPGGTPTPTTWKVRLSSPGLNTSLLDAMFLYIQGWGF